ncbi:MAG: hypothetical protein M1833_004018 [Piccolia ochrophora]|nr:MAG: hypothetical protein M1833_004018 [Piccolia ochrophora]
MTTDTAGSSITHTASSLHPVPDSAPGSAHTADGLQPTPPQVDDEPYTIKCICGFEEDDGNTVFCEKCDTWQHIECYYPAKKVPDVHNCADCEPRSLDPKRAAERQRRRREQHGLGDRKTKRLSSKSHKKKVKDANQNSVQVNGLLPHERHDHSAVSDRKNGAAKDCLPSSKRPKTNHRSSSSNNSQPSIPGVNSPSFDLAHSHLQTDRTPSHSPSTANDQSNGHNNDLYSLHFMRVHREDPGDSDMKANLFNSIAFTGTFSDWLTDPDALRAATSGHSPGEVFQRVDVPFESLDMPVVDRKIKKDMSIECYGQYPIWQYCVVNAFVPKGGLVGELKGHIGHLQDYIQKPENNWSSLHHPLPFVFFHPLLPLYIDTRQEGTLCRYIRRSCRPNVEMRTLISNGTEYHFCFCAREDVQPGSEITIGWDLEENTRRLFNRVLDNTGNPNVKTEALTDIEQDAVSVWVEKTLSHHGGCACENPDTCNLARFDRRKTRLSDATRSDAALSKRKRSTKSRQQASPLSTGRATNSRAGSEGVNHKEHEDDHDDSRSTSGSARSKPASRDMTPLTHFSSDVPMTSNGLELSDRDKRKLAALERTFEQLEQDNQHQAQKKKKRNSGGSNVNTPGVNASVWHKQSVMRRHHTNLETQKPFFHSAGTSGSQPPTPAYGPKPDYIDSGMTHKPLGSPPFNARYRQNASESPSKPSRRIPTTATPKTVSPVAQNTYTDSCVQTETTLDSEDWFYQSPTVSTRPAKAFVPLTKRLLKRCHEDRVRFEEEKKRADKGGRDEDVQMLDAPPTLEQIQLAPSPGEVSTKFVPVFSPSEASASASISEDKTKETGPDSPPTIQTIDPNVQKARPPHRRQDSENTTHMEKLHLSDSLPGNESLHKQPTNPMSPAQIKPPPPTWPSTNASSSTDAHRSVNGVRTTDLHLQLVSAPSVSAHSPSTPSTGNSIAQSPQSSSHPTITLPSAVNNVVQPSPVKKKLSLSDYKQRMKNVDATSGDRTLSGSSPTLHHPVLKPSPSVMAISEESGTQGRQALEGSAIVDSPGNESKEPDVGPSLKENRIS